MYAAVVGTAEFPRGCKWMKCKWRKYLYLKLMGSCLSHTFRCFCLSSCELFNQLLIHSDISRLPLTFVLLIISFSTDRSLMVDPLSYFSFQPVLQNWYKKGCDMCYPVCGMIHIKDSLLLIRKSIPHSGSIGFLFLRSILHGGPIELFLVPASAPELV